MHLISTNGLDKSKQKRFARIKNKVQNAKNNNLQARPFGKVIDFIESNKLIQEAVHGKITHEKALKRIKISVMILQQLLVRRHLPHTRLKC